MFRDLQQAIMHSENYKKMFKSQIMANKSTKVDLDKITNFFIWLSSPNNK